MHTHIRKNSHGKSHYRKKYTPSLTTKLENMYSHSLKNVKRKPYQTASVLVGLGIISSIYFWYRSFK